ncbi:MAG: hypothetical protein QOK06_896 [Acidimicrobiaceae bacterium]
MKYVSAIAGDQDIYAATPRARLAAARSLSPRAARKLQSRVVASGDVASGVVASGVGAWPPNSPGALNAYLLFVTTKPPTWRDKLVEWRERPLTLGHPHEGFLYPDPLGFWAEVRRWTVELLCNTEDPTFTASEALAVTALVHVGDAAGALLLACATCRPGVVLFLDEPAWQSAGWEVAAQPHHVRDPHRDGQVYQGFWGRTADGVIVGKAPQHPTMHRFYLADDMRQFLRSAPR